MTVTQKLFAPRRVGVCGSSRDLPQSAVHFCQAAGAHLASRPHVVIVSGGTRRREECDESNLAADWYVVSAAEQAIRRRGDQVSVQERIETVIGEGRGRAEQFTIGSLRCARGKTREARRFAFVRGVDALFAVGGRYGTSQELALALELGIPVLPVPVFGGAAEAIWEAYESDLVRMLCLDEATVQRWRVRMPDDSAELETLATEMVDTLLGSLPRRCFVIMPFSEDFEALYDFVIEPALRRVGDEPIRLDRAAVPGDVGGHIRDGITRCDYAIAVLDGLRENVLYELGLAHGSGKPTVLLNKVGALGDAVHMPFDIAMQQRLEYQSVSAGLTQRLEKVLAALPARRA